MTYLEAAESQQESKINYPSFSIMFETENLSSVELDNIYQSLASIAEQDISPEQANEFLIIDSGDAPAELIEQVCSMYPWITVRKVPGIGYYEAKMLGPTFTTGEVLVYCDSDCVYESNWLRNMLTPFSGNSDINIVAGETSTVVRNPYELAIAFHYFFPRFSSREQLYAGKNYFLNNVAFRREFLLKNPLPTNLPLYRGNCWLHAYSLANLNGHTIWKQPKARTTHEPPTMSFSFWRYLLRGRDQVLRDQIKLRLAENPDTTDYSKLVADLNLTPNQKMRSLAATVLRFKPFKLTRIREVLQEDPRRLMFLPLAIPVILWFELLFNIGRAITYFQPDLLLDLYEEGEGKPSELASIGVQGVSDEG